MPLTTKQIEALRPGAGPERVPDGLGLYLRITPSGRKSFELRATVKGKRCWIKIGCFPELGLKRARQLAGMVQLQLEGGLSAPEVRAALAQGTIEDLETKPELPAVPKQPRFTFRRMSKLWFEQKKLGLRNGKHIQQNWNTIETYVFPVIGEKDITEVTVTEVIEAIRPIWHDKHETAKRTLGRVKEIFALAKIRELRPDNPADFSPRIALGPVRRTKGHFPALPFERLPELWTWLQSVRCDEQSRHLCMLMLLSAKRSKECRYVQWDFLDPEGKVWTTPPDLMKMSRAHRVPVSRQMSVVLENMRCLNGKEPRVFARPSNKSGVMSENTVCKLIQRFEPGITAHGFRAGFRTWARRQSKYSLDAMEFALAHEQEALEAAYQRDDLIAERAILMQDWADYLTGGKDPVRWAKST
jgi:integrase